MSVQTVERLFAFLVGREYPMGAFDSEDVDVALVEEND